MKFIFPKNYRYKAKILGFIDYVTAIIDLVVAIILFFILKVFIKKISTLIYVFIIIYLPLLLFSIFVAGGENIITYTIIIVKFMKRRGVYVFDKSGNKQK